MLRYLQFFQESTSIVSRDFGPGKANGVATRVARASLILVKKSLKLLTGICEILNVIIIFLTSVPPHQEYNPGEHLIIKKVLMAYCFLKHNNKLNSKANKASMAKRTNYNWNLNRSAEWIAMLQKKDSKLQNYKLKGKMLTYVIIY